MALKVFLVLISIVLACSILLAVVAKNLVEGIAVSGKKAYLYGFGGAILTSVLAYLVSYISASQFEVFWSLGGIVFVFGIIHMVFLHNRFFYSDKKNNNRNRVLIGELLFGLSLILFIIIAFSALQYFLEHRSITFYHVTMSALLFFVPMLIFHSFQAAYEIPLAKFPAWHYPLNRSVTPLNVYDNDREWIIGFELAEKAWDRRKNYFRVKAPDTCQLSTLFYHFINEYNEPDQAPRIEYIDKENEPYEWWFHKKEKWYQLRKVVNPEFSIRESGIKENTVIVCERILINTPTSQYHQKIHYER